ncbi:MAG: hypothetical protein ABJB95_11930, partial [Gemmatimonadales bacterium]
ARGEDVRTGRAGEDGRSEALPRSGDRAGFARRDAASATSRRGCRFEKALAWEGGARTPAPTDRAKDS